MAQVYQANNLTYAAQASKKRGEGDGGSGGSFMQCRVYSQKR